jgi:ectoine hydroxylase-related dioxygenase (phytanoyl-CoA dioxygenase family)
MHRLPHTRALVGLVETLLGEEVFVHPRHIMRAMTPHPANKPTPPHQDFAFIQGSTRTWTAWFPIGAGPLDLGPLMVLRGSHRKGFIPWGTGYEGWMSSGTQLCENETDWVGGDYEAGDVLLFTAYTVHRGLPPTNRSEIRLSLDIRYQPASDVIEEKSLTNHSEHDWDEVYEGWPAEYADLMYYWKPKDFEFSGWDESLLQPGIRRVC